MDVDAAKRFIEITWSDSIVPALRKYVTIPNLSPAFDRQWREHGHMERAIELIEAWVRGQEMPGLALDVVRLPDRTPMLFTEIPGSAQATVLLYGHLDKQPPMQGWKEGLGPWKPVVKDGKLYGRGAADDGYAIFASIAAIKALDLQGVPHGRCVIIIEACEESGSYDLPAYIDALAARIGSPSLVVCLDSGCGNYQQLWITTSLRGLVTGNLSVSTLTEGVHSGAASGIVPSSFRIARQLLSRLEDECSGSILPPQLHTEVPGERRQQVRAAAAALGDSVYQMFPFPSGVQPVTCDVTELLLSRTWQPALEVTGAAGLPDLEHAGNVLRPHTTLKLSLRLPPTVDGITATELVKQLLERDPPYGASVEFEPDQGASGWNAPPMEQWLSESADRASKEFFGREACYIGEGGSIPFMSMLGEKFPRAQFAVTGLLGPHSNAHGPNEFLDIATGMKLTGCVARLLADHCRASRDLGDEGTY